MIVLGKNNDDKGHQLEQLTRTLLTALGYRSIAKNFVGAGGEEIDVRAKYHVPGLGSGSDLTLICECKARRNPVSLPDWLKFLGKVFHEQTVSGDQVHGCFIALSGVNGNVHGHFDVFSRKNSRITLVAGEELSRVISSQFECSDSNSIVTILQKRTPRRHRSIDLAYYDDRAYWMIGFDDGNYTLLSQRGESLPRDVIEQLLPMLGESVAGTYVDLAEEDQARKREFDLQKKIVAHLIIEGGRSSQPIIMGEPENFSQSEVANAVRVLVDRGWLAVETNGATTLVLEKEDGVEFRPAVNLLTFLLHEYVPIPVLGAATYDAMIDEVLLTDILHLQGDLSLSDEDRGRAVKLLRWSPSALTWALRPDPMIVKHRIEQPFIINTETTKFARNYFFAQLNRNFVRDFEHSELNHYFLTIRGLRELETTQRLIIKTTEGIRHEDEFCQRRGKAPFQGGGIVSVLLLATAPQPWDLEQPSEIIGASLQNLEGHSTNGS